jgi:dolichyl-phosphate beta-glucosyltransferase
VSLIFVSVVIPTYNEGGCIQSNLQKVVNYLHARFSQFEVIVVDDGSTDDTQKKVAESANKEPRIRLVPFSANHGKGFVVRQGVLQARGDAIFFTDADLSTPVEEIEAGLEALGAHWPVVVASRRHPESAIILQQSRGREAIGRIFNRVVRRLLSLPFHDTQCGFKGFAREAAREIFSLARIDGFAFDAEILVIARRLGHRVKEIPVYWTNSPNSKVRPARHMSLVVRDLLKIYRNDRAGLYSPQA